MTTAHVPKVGIVLGAALLAPNVASPSLKRRAQHAAKAFLQGEISVIIACGGVGAFPPSEAELIAKTCIDMGVPENKIVQEKQSRNTTENIRFAVPHLEKFPGHDVVIITDGYHALRAKYVARQYGLRVSSSSPQMKRTPLVSRVKAYARECVALVWYVMKSHK